MKNKVMPTVVLTVICLTVALLLSVVNMFTAPEIQKAIAKKEDEAKKEVLEAADSFTSVDINNFDGAPTSVTAAYRANNGAGFVFKTETKGYDVGLVLMIGISADGKISGTSVISSNETFGAESLLGAEYVGKTEGESSTVIKKNSATYTSNAFNQAIRDSFKAMSLILSEGGNVNE